MEMALFCLVFWPAMAHFLLFFMNSSLQADDFTDPQLEFIDFLKTGNKNIVKFISLFV
jgi:hypothetical protein